MNINVNYDYDDNKLFWGIGWKHETIDNGKNWQKKVTIPSHYFKLLSWETNIVLVQSGLAWQTGDILVLDGTEHVILSVRHANSKYDIELKKWINEHGRFNWIIGV